MEYCYKYPRPALTVDAIVIARDLPSPSSILLIQRKSDPYKGKWALPGGFVDVDETVKEAAVRELKEETGVEGIELEQFHVFDAPHRDPRERTISVVYYGFTDRILKVKGSDDAQDAKWFPLDALPELAFDHEQIIERFMRKLIIDNG
jgi:8-oxo-dGTP diphosphatase